MNDLATEPQAAAEVPARVSRVWRIVGMVVAFQIVAILGMVVLFSAMGLANDGVGSCGGG